MRKRKLRKQRKKYSDYLRGSITIVLLFVIIVVGAIMLTGGISKRKAPKVFNSEKEAIVDESSLPQENQQKSLQIQELKFKKGSHSVPDKPITPSPKAPTTTPGPTLPRPTSTPTPTINPNAPTSTPTPTPDPNAPTPTPFPTQIPSNNPGTFL